MQKATALLKNLAIVLALLAAIAIASQNKAVGGLLFAIILGFSAFSHARSYLQKIIAPKIYACVFEKEIIAADGKKVAVFDIKYALPFPPFIGLAVGGHLNPLSEDSDVNPQKHDQKPFFIDEIIGIRWVFSKFICNVTPHKIAEGEVLEEIIIVLCDHSWQLQDLYFREKERVLEYIDRALSQTTSISAADRDRYARAKTKLENMCKF